MMTLRVGCCGPEYGVPLPCDILFVHGGTHQTVDFDPRREGYGRMFYHALPAMLGHGAAEQAVATFLTDKLERVLTSQDDLDMDRPLSIDFPPPMCAGFVQIPVRIANGTLPIMVKLMKWQNAVRTDLTEAVRERARQFAQPVSEPPRYFISLVISNNNTTMDVRLYDHQQQWHADAVRRLTPYVAGLPGLGVWEVSLPVA